jgi:nitrogen fixation/metabolism regulation signal transduction histidine kinase
MSGDEPRRPEGRRWPRLGLRREVLILLPVAMLLLAVLSTATVAAYWSSIAQLVEERQNEAARLAGEAADRLATAAKAKAPGPPLRELAPGAQTVLVTDSAGHLLASSGEVPPAMPLAPLAGRLLGRPLGLGPDDDKLPGVVAGFASWQSPAGPRTVRVDFDAGVLAAQSRSVRLLGVFVLSIDGALIVLVLLFVRHLLAPYELLLARARQMGPAGGDVAAESPGDEVELLLSVFERAVATLTVAEASPAADDDFAALERTLAHSLQSGLLLLDRAGCVLALNPVGADLLGVAPPESAAPLGAVLAGQPELCDLLVQAVDSGQAPQRQECPVHSGRRTLTLGVTVHPLRRDDGGVRGYLVLFADLTEPRRRAEERRLADHMTRLAEMGGGIAHELRNSLATLRGYLTLIERRPDEESIADYLSEIRQESDHLERVLADFLSFARPGSLRSEEVSLTRLAQRAAADPALEGFAVHVHGADAEVSLRGDAQLLERALRNLVHNAVQAEKEAGRDGPVELCLERQPAGVELTVDDRGPGLSPEIRERLFHPFATGRRGGVGLGLALAHRIVVLHGGTIHLEDRPGGGTRARLFFPAAGQDMDTASPG